MVWTMSTQNDPTGRTYTNQYGRQVSNVGGNGGFGGMQGTWRDGVGGYTPPQTYDPRNTAAGQASLQQFWDYQASLGGGHSPPAGATQFGLAVPGSNQRVGQGGIIAGPAVTGGGFFPTLPGPNGNLGGGGWTPGPGNGIGSIPVGRGGIALPTPWNPNPQWGDGIVGPPGMGGMGGQPSAPTAPPTLAPMPQPQAPAYQPPPSSGGGQFGMPDLVGLFNSPVALNGGMQPQAGQQLPNPNGLAPGLPPGTPPWATDLPWERPNIPTINDWRDQQREQQEQAEQAEVHSPQQQGGSLLDNLLGQLPGGQIPGMGAPPGTGTTPGTGPLTNVGTPQIPLGPIITPQQMDQMINSALAGNIQQEQGGRLAAQRDMAARGFSGGSPALQSTMNRLGLNRAIADTQARSQIPIDVAQTNANYGLEALGGLANQRALDIGAWTGIQNAITGRIGSTLSPLLSALVNLS